MEALMFIFLCFVKEVYFIFKNHRNKKKEILNISKIINGSFYLN